MKVRTEKQIQDGVAKGAKLLDERVKDWVTEFVARGCENGFDMADARCCVLGNTFQRFTENNPDLAYTTGVDRLDLGDVRAAALGFNLNDIEANYDDESTWRHLADAWQYEILKRVMKRKDARVLFDAAVPLFAGKYNEEEPR